MSCINEPMPEEFINICTGKKYTIAELERHLDHNVRNEQFEKAVIFRDEINRRKLKEKGKKTLADIYKAILERR